MYADVPPTRYDRGMTRTIAIALVLLAACKDKESPSQKSARRGDDAGFTVKVYAYEAYPSWAAAHPNKACPDRIEELNEYMNRSDVADPWGGSYKMVCGAALPAGAKGIAISSPGPDGKEGTPDDVKSW